MSYFYYKTTRNEFVTKRPIALQVLENNTKRIEIRAVFTRAGVLNGPMPLIIGPSRKILRTRL